MRKMVPSGWGGGRCDVTNIDEEEQQQMEREGEDRCLMFD